MYKWLKYYNYRTIIVATKIDKLSRSQLLKNLKIIKDTLKPEAEDEILTFSSLNKQGKERVLEGFGICYKFLFLSNVKYGL